MEPLTEIKAWLQAALHGARLEVIANPGPAKQDSLLVDAEHAVAVAKFLRDDPRLQFDYASSVTGVDYLDKALKEKVKTRQVVDGVEKDVEQMVEKKIAGYLEAVYHLYSTTLKHGPLVFRQRTPNRTDQARVASLTPVYRGAEFQEREAYDLYGILFEGHPDLRRILMWDEFKDYPMRKDYREPDDYEWEPTAHGEVLEKANRHYLGPTEPPPPKV